MLARTSHLTPLISSPQGPASRFPFFPWTASILPLCSRAGYFTHLLSHQSLPTLVCSRPVEEGAAPIKLSQTPWAGCRAPLCDLPVALVSCVMRVLDCGT